MVMRSSLLMQACGWGRLVEQDQCPEIEAAPLLDGGHGSVHHKPRQGKPLSIFNRLSDWVHKLFTCIIFIRHYTPQLAQIVGSAVAPVGNAVVNQKAMTTRRQWRHSFSKGLRQAGSARVSLLGAWPRARTARERGGHHADHSLSRG